MFTILKSLSIALFIIVFTSGRAEASKWGAIKNYASGVSKSASFASRSRSVYRPASNLSVKAVRQTGVRVRTTGFSTNLAAVNVPPLKLIKNQSQLSLARVNKTSENLRSIGKTKGIKSKGPQQLQVYNLNKGKTRVKMHSPSRRIEVDLRGSAHAGIPTPHTKVSPVNKGKVPPEIGVKYQGNLKGSTKYSTKQELRMSRKYLESRTKRVAKKKLKSELESK